MLKKKNNLIQIYTVTWPKTHEYYHTLDINNRNEFKKWRKILRSMNMELKIETKDEFTNRILKLHKTITIWKLDVRYVHKNINIS